MPCAVGVKARLPDTTMPPIIPAIQHNIEISRNREAWRKRELVREIYRGFYSTISQLLCRDIPGEIVELGSGMGNIKEVIPDCITTDLFPNPWLDRQENAYALTFADASVSNLILFDVWHHLAHPGTALDEFARVVCPGGRLILFEPGMGWLGQLIYGFFHHEPLAWKHEFVHRAPAGFDAAAAPYFAAQSSATRMFLRHEFAYYRDDWRLVEARPFSSLAYAGSGGFSKPQMYPKVLLPAVRLLDRVLSRVPRLFATRLIVVLERKGPSAP
jgi:SAM-dependent methyltransferase